MQGISVHKGPQWHRMPSLLQSPLPQHESLEAALQAGSCCRRSRVSEELVISTTEARVCPVMAISPVAAASQLRAPIFVILHTIPGVICSRQHSPKKAEGA